MTADRIEREILIAAPLERVWSLVTEPGFWVGAGDPSGADLREGQLFVATYAEQERYPLRVERIDAPRYVSYRWASAFPGEEPGAGNSTLVEFTLSPEGEGTRLRVAESGFAGLDAPEETRRKAHSDNTGGWAKELDALRARAEQLVA
jgi:uncharacterized protein YndB with AHSA1/START domain